MTMNEQEKDIRECLSDSHREFMRSYIDREEKKSQAVRELFSATRLRQRGKVPQSH